VTLLANSALLSTRLRTLAADDVSPEGYLTSDRTERLQWLAFFNLLEPPDYNSTRMGLTTGPRLARREATHAMDLSRWSTRPCLVVIGTLSTAGENVMPAPVRVQTNGAERTPYCSGKTIVRWVYPLPPDPPQVIVESEEGQEGENAPAAPADEDGGGE
jgi:hypothetical protein